jgi:hypothetical protein
MRAMKVHWKPEWIKRPVFSKARPAHGLLGEVEDGTDAVLGVRLLHQPAREEHWL